MRRMCDGHLGFLLYALMVAVVACGFVDGPSFPEVDATITQPAVTEFGTSCASAVNNLAGPSQLDISFTFGGDADALTVAAPAVLTWTGGSTDNISPITNGIGMATAGFASVGTGKFAYALYDGFNLSHALFCTVLLTPNPTAQLQVKATSTQTDTVAMYIGAASDADPQNYTAVGEVSYTDIGTPISAQSEFLFSWGGGSGVGTGSYAIGFAKDVGLERVTAGQTTTTYNFLSTATSN